MKNVQGKIPVLLSLSFVFAIVAVGAVRLASWSGYARAGGAGLIALYLVWLGIEARVAVGEIGRGSTSLDRSTLEVYAVGRALTVVTALALGAAPSPTRLALGVGIFGLGVGLRLVAIHQLGRFYSHRVRVSAEQHIVDRGPYRVLRHPAYTGMLLAHAGFVVVFFDPIAAAVLALFFVPAVVARILVEEKALMSLDGYANYCRTRARLMPGVW